MTDEKLNNVAQAAFFNIGGNQVSNPWTAEDVDKPEVEDIDEFREVTDLCRFFYKRDPIASTVINKLIDIGVTQLDFEHAELKPNQEKLIESMLPSFEEFAEVMALEYLLSGLLVPEVSFTAVPKEELNKLGVKRYSTFVLPTDMWLRDPMTIKIKQVWTSKPSYYVEIPDEMIHFIQTGGYYDDNTEDKELYRELATRYPKFVAAVKAGKTEVKLDNDRIERRRVVSGSPYPVPYLYGATESMKHKRNIRRMDYSVASRVISAIQLIKAGNDEYPLTEDDDEVLEGLKDKMYWRNSSRLGDIERIFQLFTNHTVTVEWVFPDMSSLLDDSKYKDVNRDIFYALGFPAILVTGETERSSASEAEYALLSPIKTMENFRYKLLKILNDILEETLDLNDLKLNTQLRFKPINLQALIDFYEILTKLYESGSLSREEYVAGMGYNLDDELEKLEGEKAKMEEMDLPEFGPQPFAREPKNMGGDGEDSQEKPEKEEKLEDS
jgi:hypothetical protein